MPNLNTSGLRISKEATVKSDVMKEGEIMYPLIFTPDFKEKVWGGEKLKTVFNKDIPFEHTGESWEVACHDHGFSMINNGEYKGMTLKELVDKYPMDVLGYELKAGDKFPLLVKFIDAKADLSVQVHPEDEYANIHENGELGKNEAWYVLEAEEGATLVAGLKDGTTKESFRQALNEGKLESVLNEIQVTKGDVINIPAGFVHAIGAGVLLAEVQQNSDTTYRVYDYNRLGLDGKPRELHVEKSLDVIDFEGKHSKELVEGVTDDKGGYNLTSYIKNKYFSLEKVDITDEYVVDNANGFEIYLCIDGTGSVTSNGTTYPVKKGDSLLIPSALDGYTFLGELSMVKSYVLE